MLDQNQIDQMMEDITEADGNVMIVPDPEPSETQPYVPDFFSIMKEVCFWWVR